MEPYKILLVDDDPDDVSIITDAILDVQPHAEIFSAANGVLAVKFLNENPEIHKTLCLIVLDLNMPKMNGTESLTKFKTDDRFRTIPVIICSTSVNDTERDKCLQLGAHMYITKPMSLRESKETALLFIETCKLRFAG